MAGPDLQEERTLRLLLESWGKGGWRVHLGGWLEGRADHLRDLVAGLIERLQSAYGDQGFAKITVPAVENIPPSRETLFSPLDRGMWQAIEELEVWLRPGAILTERLKRARGKPAAKTQGNVSGRTFDSSMSKGRRLWKDNDATGPEIAQLKIPSDQAKRSGAKYPLLEFFRGLALLERWRCGDEGACQQLVTELWKTAVWYSRQILRSACLEECAFYVAVEELELAVLPGSKFTSPNPDDSSRWVGAISGRKELGLRSPVQWFGQAEFRGYFRKILKARVSDCRRKLPDKADRRAEDGSEPDFPDARKNIEEKLANLAETRSQVIDLVENLACCAEQIVTKRQRQAVLALNLWLKRCVANHSRENALLSDRDLPRLRIERLVEKALEEIDEAPYAPVPDVHEFVRDQLRATAANYYQICRRLRAELQKVVGVSREALQFLEGFAVRYKK